MRCWKSWEISQRKLPSIRSRLFTICSRYLQLYSQSSSCCTCILLCPRFSLKIVKGVYIDIILGDAADWLTAVYNIFDKAMEEDEKARLKKVWNSWKQFGVDWAMFLRNRIVSRRRGCCIVGRHRYCTKSSRWIIETTLHTSCTNANMMKCRQMEWMS